MVIPGRLGPRAASVIVLAGGAAACLALNLPGHLSYDSVVQLAEGRSGVYNGDHPPIMSWVLGLADAVFRGPALFVAIVVLVIFAALAVFLLLGRRPSWWVLLLAAGLCAAPQLAVYPAIVWKDVLFAASAVAGFACLAWFAVIWPRRVGRVALLALGVAFLALASLTRQNGVLVLPFAAAAAGWIAARKSGSAFKGLSYGLVFFAAAGSAIAAGDALLGARVEEAHPVAQAWSHLEVYDLAGAARRDPRLRFSILSAAAPALAAEIRTRDAALYTPARIDPLGPDLDRLDLSPELERPVARQWLALVLRRPLLYLRVRTAAFAWVFLSLRPSQCVMVETGVDGPAEEMGEAGLVERKTGRDEALESYALAFSGTPVSSHATYALVALALLVFLMRRRTDADLAVAAMLAGALAFAGSFALISLACDYRYLYALDLSAMAAALYAAATFNDGRKG